jgi:hypothetical protein
MDVNNNCDEVLKSPAEHSCPGLQVGIATGRRTAQFPAAHPLPSANARCESAKKSPSRDDHPLGLPDTVASKFRKPVS